MFVASQRRVAVPGSERDGGESGSKVCERCFCKHGTGLFSACDSSGLFVDPGSFWFLKEVPAPSWQRWLDLYGGGVARGQQRKHVKLRDRILRRGHHDVLLRRGGDRVGAEVVVRPPGRSRRALPQESRCRQLSRPCPARGWQGWKASPSSLPKHGPARCSRFPPALSNLDILLCSGMQN